MTPQHRQALEDLDAALQELRQAKAFFDGAYVDAPEMRERISRSIEGTLAAMRVDPSPYRRAAQGAQPRRP